MKLKYKIALLLLIFANMASAQISVGSFKVLSQYLQDGKILIKNGVPKTEIKIEVLFTASTDNQGYANLAQIKTRLATGSNNGQLVYLSAQETTTSAEFERYKSTLTKTYTIEIEKAKLTSGFVIALRIDASHAFGEGDHTGKYYHYFLDAPTFDPTHLTKIQSMGFSTTDIQNFSSTHYLVEGDIMLSKNYVSNWATSSPASQVTTYNINILKPSFLWQIGGPWEAAFFRAIHAWNSMPNCKIKLHAIDELTNIYADARPIDISLVSQSNLSSRPVISSFPIGDGKPGSQILINPNFRYPGTNSIPTIEQATWNLVQAIGHTLGFKHVIGTGTEASVMRINTSTSSYSSQLTAPLDANPINAIYPLDANSILTPTVMGVSTKSHMEGNGFSISYSETGVTYSWRVVGINGTVWDRSYGEDYTSILPELYLPIGQYQIRCTITGGKFGANPVTATKDISVY